MRSRRRRAKTQAARPQDARPLCANRGKPPNVFLPRDNRIKYIILRSTVGALLAFSLERRRSDSSMDVDCQGRSGRNPAVSRRSLDCRPPRRLPAIFDSGRGVRSMSIFCGDGLRGLARSQQRLEKVSRDVPHDRHTDPVSTAVVGVVVAFRKPVLVAQPHEPGRFSGRQQWRPNCLALDNENCLTRRTAGRPMQAACGFVEANFGPLSLSSALVRARSPPRAAPRQLAQEIRHRGEDRPLLETVPSDAKVMSCRAGYGLCSGSSSSSGSQPSSG